MQVPCWFGKLLLTNQKAVTMWHTQGKSITVCYHCSLVELNLTYCFIYWDIGKEKLKSIKWTHPLNFHWLNIVYFLVDNIYINVDCVPVVYCFLLITFTAGFVDWTFLFILWNEDWVLNSLYIFVSNQQPVYFHCQQ